MTMVMVVSVTCDKNERFINRIQTELDTEDQAIFMGIVSAVMDDGHGASQSTPPASDDSEFELEEEISRLIMERERHNALREELAQRVVLLEQENKELKREDLSYSAKLVSELGLSGFAESKDYIAELETELRAVQDKMVDQEKTIRELSGVVAEIPLYKSTIGSLEGKLAEKEGEIYRLKNESMRSVNRRKSTSALSESQEDMMTSSKDSVTEDLKRQLESAQLEIARLMTEKMDISDVPVGSIGLIPEMSTSKLEECVNQQKTADILEHIALLTQQLKEVKAENESLDIETKQLQTELELVSSAWYSLASRVQQENTAITKSSNQTPSGWLTKQRESMNRIY
ncbi:hypothetical protein TRVA0_013S01640 [Trichomonascus vanleenenianus]|uniref:uncharacterized protein n=1 Tax=Trichomonascus vanleenenianus TaxID=2268995 RepID=UPI003EC9FE22